MSRQQTAAGIVILLSLLGCEQAAEPVGEVRIGADSVSLPYPGYAQIRLEWTANAPLGTVEGDPLVFVHLLDEPGNVIRTFDHTLPFDWRPGESYSYEITLYQSALAPPLDNGEYHLSVGLYDRSGRRWPLDAAGIEVDDYEYQVATVSVDGAAEDVPMFYFSPTWLPLEAGTDTQIVTRRWLTDVGRIRVAEIPGHGSVWMRMRIPSPEAGVETLSLTGGASEPVVLVSGSCSGDEVRLSGVGYHEFHLVVKAADDGVVPEECEIELTPNFHLVELKTLARRSLALEIISWSAS